MSFELNLLLKDWEKKKSRASENWKTSTRIICLFNSSGFCYELICMVTATAVPIKTCHAEWNVDEIMQRENWIKKNIVYLLWINRINLIFLFVFFSLCRRIYLFVFIFLFCSCMGTETKYSEEEWKSKKNLCKKWEKNLKISLLKCCCISLLCGSCRDIIITISIFFIFPYQVCDHCYFLFFFWFLPWVSMCAMLSICLHQVLIRQLL